MTPQREPIGRRAFLWTAALGGLAALLGEWVPRRWLAADTLPAPFRIPGATDLPVGSALSFTIPSSLSDLAVPSDQSCPEPGRRGERSIEKTPAAGPTIPGVLVRVAADTYAAFDQRCPHLGCPVQWSRARARFECPCHKAVFEDSGRVVSGPPQRGLRRIVLERRGDDVWALQVATDEEGRTNERSV